jgi:type I restriction enzyme S subunit
MKQYTYYKNINFPGLKKLPEGWNYNKLVRICYMKGRIGWQGLKQSEFTTEGPYLITGMNFKNGKIRWNEVYHITQARYDEAPEIQLKAGDVLMTKDGTIGKLLYIDALPGKASLNSHLLVLRPLSGDFQPKYLYYVLQSEVFKTHIELYKTGTTFYGISQEAVGRFKMILPPLKEQEIIIHYLDYKLSKIDELITKKQNLIELLKEERIATINQAVTKGINPNVEMIDSRVEWLGVVPKHWIKIPLKRILKSSDYGLSESSLMEGEFKYIGMGHIQDGNVILENVGHLNNVPEELLLENMDLLYNRTNSEELVCKVGLFRGNKCDKVTFASYLVRFRLREDYSPEYINFLLNSTNFLHFARAQALKSINQSNLNPTKYLNLFVFVPNIDEQQEIVRFIKSTVLKIDISLNQIQKEIDLLQEYRTALISEVVTGKVDVRDEMVAGRIAARDEVVSWT